MPERVRGLRVSPKIFWFLKVAFPEFYKSLVCPIKQLCSAMLASLVRTPCCFVRLHTRLVTTGIYSVEMSQAFHHVDKVQTWILLKYAFSATQNWEKDASQIYLMVLYIFSTYAGFTNMPNLAYVTPKLFRWLHRGYGGSRFDSWNFW